ncbi:MAG: hypothetical protein HYR70_11385 [Chloroflexi bacterium]|nr:hypothetical protein [Chloroflexota bacterium]MBI3338708.1 hypothetical protein [Chloroflexota bacterium]
MIQQRHSLLSALILATVLLSACQPSTPPVNVNTQLTQAVGTAFASIQQTQIASTPLATNTPSAAATALRPPRTPPALPPAFQTQGLNPGVAPKAYISDVCQYLKAKWDSNNAAPGTIVMVLFFHGIDKGTETSPDPTRFGSGDFKRTMQNLYDMGFQAINTQQLSDFVYNNAKIPSRSVVLIEDDRHALGNFNDWFRPYREQWGWPVVNGWISVDGGKDINLADNVALEKEGWVDHQAHGVIHNVPMTDSSTDKFIYSELQGSIDIFQQYYGKKPIAIIWPGGGFGLRPVQIARKLGYQLGFTINPRGPIMFNWVPQADQPTTSFDIAEGPVSDPPMTLPRYWPSQVISSLDQIRQIGSDAAAYAEQNKATELEYYDIVCAPTYGPIP